MAGPFYYSQMSEKPTIHVIDDDDAVRDSLGLLLNVEGFNVLVYTSCAAFLHKAVLDGNCCLLVDIHMPGVDGLALLDQLRRDGINTPTILMTGRIDGRIRRAAEHAGAVLLEKPFRMGDVVASIEAAVGRNRMSGGEPSRSAAAIGRASSL